ncbi:MAG: TetR family transcriptional regulator [Propioniciclava sp.]
MTDVSARRARTRDRICDAAVQVFALQGVRGASVEEICDVAGFTRGAFYSNFESKDGLCAAVLERHVTAVVAAVDGVVDRLVPTTDLRLDAVIELGISTFLAAQPTDPNVILTSEELRLYAAREPAFRDTFARLERLANESIAARIEAALVQHGCELMIPGEEAVRLLHAVYEYGSIGTLIYPPSPPADVRSTVLNQLLRSLIRPQPVVP